MSKKGFALAAVGILFLCAGGVAVVEGCNTGQQVNEAVVSDERPLIGVEKIEVTEAVVEIDEIKDKQTQADNEVITKEKTDKDVKEKNSKAEDSKESSCHLRQNTGKRMESNEDKVKEIGQETRTDTQHKNLADTTTTISVTTEQSIIQLTETKEEISIEDVSLQETQEENTAEQITSQETIALTTEVATEEKQEVVKVWHEPITEQVWVVDHEAWTETWEEPATEYHDVCNYCGAIIDGKGSEHLSESWLKVVNGEISREELCYGYRTDVAFDVIVTKTLEHPEEGHYETVVIEEGYWE